MYNGVRFDPRTMKMCQLLTKNQLTRSKQNKSIVYRIDYLNYSKLKNIKERISGFPQQQFNDT